MNLIRWIYNKYVGFMYPAHKELSDQTLHFSLGFLLSTVQMMGRPFWWAIPLSALVSYGVCMTREYYQHKHIVWYNFDLLFGAIGSLGGAVILFVLLS